MEHRWRGGGAAVFDYNRVYASELLVILLQNSHEARETLGMKQSGDAVDKILRAVASYRKRDPESSQEVGESRPFVDRDGGT